MAQPPIPILLAVTGASYEAALVTRLERSGQLLRVVRRCVDLADLLSAASTGIGRAALIADQVRRLDREALARLAAAGVVPVGVVAPGDTQARRRLRMLGVREVASADASVDVLTAAVAAALRAGWEGPPAEHAVGDPRAALPADDDAEADDPGTATAAGAAGAADDADADGDAGNAQIDGTAPPRRGARRREAGLQAGGSEPESGAAAGAVAGQVLAVWGPTGAPGRTTVAAGLAAELAAAGTTALLVDADVYGGVVAQVLGLLDDAPGLAAATRLANAGTLDLAALARVAPLVGNRLRVLGGVSRPDRWPEIRPAAMSPVLELCRKLAQVTVVDCGFNLERDEELSFDVAAPRRNGATLVTLEHADLVLAVGGSDPVGISRLVRGLAELRELLPGQQPRVVLNRVRRGPVGPDPERQLAAALARYAGVHDVVFVPDDRAALDAALLTGRSLVDAAPRSPARLALRSLASELAGAPRPARGRRRLARRPAYG